MQYHYFEWNKQGLFVLPNESAPEYEARVQKLLKEAPVSSAIVPAVLHETFDVVPSWLAVSYSKTDLYPWEAGCTWYEEVPRIQLHPKLQTSKLLGIYSNDEVLAHEYVHAVRAPLESSRFEELFAYLTSRGFFSFLRKSVGPLFNEPKDAFLLLGCTLLITAVSLFAWAYVAYALLFGAVMAIFFTSRLGHIWWQYHRCKQNLIELVGKKALLPLMVRLTDEEIVLFSRLSTDEIVRYIIAQKETNFRWQQLHSAYITKGRS